MKPPKYLTVGELSRISSLSSRILRHYDQIGLLKPDKVDAVTGYRYYSPGQIFLVSLIQDLKAMGFSLSEIKEAMDRQDLNRLKKIYEKKQKEIQKQVEKLVQIQENIAYRLELFDKISFLENNLQDFGEFYPELKKLPERKVIYTAYQSPFNFETVAFRVRELQQIIEKQQVKSQGPYLMIFHENYEKPENSSMELACFLSPSETREAPYFRILSGGTFLCALCWGIHEDSIALYQKMLFWIQDRGYEVCGSPMKIYLKSLAFTDSPHQLLSEIQIPVRKILKF